VLLPSSVPGGRTPKTTEGALIPYCLSGDFFPQFISWMLNHAKKLEMSMSGNSSVIPMLVTGGVLANTRADTTSWSSDSARHSAASNAGKEASWFESEVAGDTPQLSNVDGAENGLRSGARQTLAGVVAFFQPCGSPAMASPSVFAVRFCRWLCASVGCVAAAAALSCCTVLWTRQVCVPR
jgi:hypothetical protein